ncbi:hypothetical protein HK405_003963 [Cladochytrium tenue]|nr:hypothetical protein HK405_003963 [Cladochytrium tenue]
MPAAARLPPLRELAAAIAGRVALARTMLGGAATHSTVALAAPPRQPPPSAPQQRSSLSRTPTLDYGSAAVAAAAVGTLVEASVRAGAGADDERSRPPRRRSTAVSLPLSQQQQHHRHQWHFATHRVTGVFESAAVEADFQAELAGRLLPRANTMLVWSAVFVAAYAAAELAVSVPAALFAAYCSSAVVVQVAAMGVMISVALAYRHSPEFIARRMPYLHVLTVIVGGVLLITYVALANEILPKTAAFNPDIASLTFLLTFAAVNHRAVARSEFFLSQLLNNVFSLIGWMLIYRRQNIRRRRWYVNRLRIETLQYGEAEKDSAVSPGFEILPIHDSGKIPWWRRGAEAWRSLFLRFADAAVEELYLAQTVPGMKRFHRLDLILNGTLLIFAAFSDRSLYCNQAYNTFTSPSICPGTRYGDTIFLLRVVLYSLLMIPSFVATFLPAAKTFGFMRNLSFVSIITINAAHVSVHFVLLARYHNNLNHLTMSIPRLFAGFVETVNPGDLTSTLFLPYSFVSTLAETGRPWQMHWHVSVLGITLFFNLGLSAYVFFPKYGPGGSSTTGPVPEPALRSWILGYIPTYATTLVVALVVKNMFDRDARDAFACRLDVRVRYARIYPEVSKLQSEELPLSESDSGEDSYPPASTAVASTRRGGATTAATTAAVAALAALLLWTHWNDPLFHYPRIPHSERAAFYARKRGSTTPSGGTVLPRLPLVGDLPRVLANIHRLHDAAAEMYAANAETAQIEGRPILNCILLPFTPPIIGSDDPAFVEHVLKTRFDVYEKGQFFFSRTQDILGHGIFAVDGDEWRAQRKTAALIFNVRNFREYVSVVFAGEMDRLASRLGRAADAGETLDLQDLFFRFTLDSFCRIGFGRHLGTLERETPIAFAAAFDAAQMQMISRFNTPLWWLLELVLPAGRAHRRNVAAVKSFGRTIVQERLAKRESAALAAAASDGEETTGEEEKPDGEADLLSFLMRSPDPISGQPPTPDQLVDYVINFIIAGRDTTAQALSWTFLMLHRHPAARDALLAELYTAFPPPAEGVADDAGDISHATYEQVRGLRYANAVFHETLRLYPSVPVEMKQANRADVLPSGATVPKGALVSWSPYSMGRSKRIWGPDAAEFRPERWLEGGQAATKSAFEYPVFNGGPRTCLGKSMAELEGVFVLVEVLRRFEVSVVEHEKVTYARSMTLPMRGGMRVTVARRRPAAPAAL